MNNQIIIYTLAFCILISPNLFADQNDFKRMIKDEIIQNGNKVSEALAKSLVTKIENIEDIKEISENSVEQLSERVATGEATKEQILILSLHKDNRQVMEAFMKGRAAVSDEIVYFRVGIIDGDNQVERSILYDVAMLPEKGKSDQLELLLEKVKNKEDVAFRILLSQSIRFIENEMFLREILDRFLEDERNAIRGAPSGTNYFLRVCDVAAHEFYSKLGVKIESRLRLSNSDLEAVPELYEKFINKSSHEIRSNDRYSIKSNINTRVSTDLPKPSEELKPNNSNSGGSSGKKVSNLPWIIGAILLLSVAGGILLKLRRK